jgi:WD40 repeat protein
MASASSSAPKDGFEGDRTAPKASLRLEWAYGYRSANCRSNVHLTESGELVYFSAAVAIVQNITDRNNYQQRFFLGHDDDIISSCLHPNRTIVATGQIGKNARICVWNTQGVMKLESLLQGHTDAVGAMSFSKDGKVNKLSLIFAETIAFALYPFRDLPVWVWIVKTPSKFGSGVLAKLWPLLPAIPNAFLTSFTLAIE